METSTSTSNTLLSIQQEVNKVVARRKARANCKSPESKSDTNSAKRRARKSFLDMTENTGAVRVKRFADYERKISHLRREHNYDQRKLSALLDDPRVNEKKASKQIQNANGDSPICVVSTFTENEVSLYKEIAARNLSVAEIDKQFNAGRFGLRDPRDPEDEFAIAVLRIENKIINQAWKSRLLIPKTRGRRSGDKQRDLDEAHDAERRAIVAGSSETGSLSIIERGDGKALESFEHGGQIVRRHNSSSDFDTAAGTVQDDYSEESGA